jgi:hypothetical protein
VQYKRNNEQLKEAIERLTKKITEKERKVLELQQLSNKQGVELESLKEEKE